MTVYSLSGLYNGKHRSRDRLPYNTSFSLIPSPRLRSPRLKILSAKGRNWSLQCCLRETIARSLARYSTFLESLRGLFRSLAVNEAVNSTPSPLPVPIVPTAACPTPPMLRSARLQDLSRLSTLLTECFHPPVGWMYWANPILKLGIYEDLRSRLQSHSPHYLCLVAVLLPSTRETKSLGQFSQYPAELAGTIELTLRSSGLFGSQYPYIANLAVSPPYRRRGIARQLLKTCEPTAKKWGFREIYLHVLENNVNAIALYDACGYQLHHTEANLGNWLWQRPRRLLLRKVL
jgi:ribosomal protein S18 acetylase RimI-like enzyme